MDLVQVIRSESEAKVLIDPVRREILRLLASEPFSGAKLAVALGISPPSASHQLSVLRKAGFISVSRREEGKHGIVQKFYRPSAHVYVIDKRPLPLSILRYFTPLHVERARGIVAALGLKNGFSLSAQALEKAAGEFSTCLVDVAGKFVGLSSEEDSELSVSKLYRQALAACVRANPTLFPKIL